MNNIARNRMVRNLVLLIALTFLACGVWSESKAQGLVAFKDLPLGPVPQTFSIAGVTFFANCTDAEQPRIFDSNEPAERGYNFLGCGVTVVLPMVAKAVELRVCQFAGDTIKVETLDSAGSPMSSQTVEYRDECGEVSIQKDRISRIRLTGAENEASIVWLRFS